jgi:trk system potassium uptake protein
MKRFIVIGLGNFGMSVSESLHAKGFEVIAIDTDSDLVDQAAGFVSRAVVGDGTNVSLLERLGVKGCDAGVVATGDDINVQCFIGPCPSGSVNQTDTCKGHFS